MAIHVQSTESTKRLYESARNAPAPTVEATARLLEAVVERHGQASTVTHALNALTRLVLMATEPQDLVPDTAGSDYHALIQLLDRPEFLAELRQEDPLAAARMRGLMVREQLLNAEGGSCSSSAMARALGITRQAIDKRRRNGTLIALSLGRRGYSYPTWQVGLDGLELVLAELSGYDPWTKAAFMLTPNNWLDGETPLSELRGGNLTQVIRVAQLYGEHIAV